MSLASLEESIYLLLNNFIKIINKHAKIEDYAIVKDRFKRFKKNVLIKIFVRCDIYNKTKFVNNKRRIISSRKKNCDFIVIAKLKNNYENSKIDKER